jgi:thiol-disulfide isomerase/thioredoxin
VSRPAVFAELDFASALARSVEQHKFLLVDATAEWCGPCKVMDLVTWVAPSVESWIAEHAIAIQLDVDASQETAQYLEVRAMPTMIVFRNGAEIDRVSGAQKPDDLVAWLDGLRHGVTALEVKRKEAAASPEDMHARLQLARMLFTAGKLDEATDEFVWLWEHMLEYEPAMYGVRHSFMIRELQTLVGKHAPAREAVVRLRERAAPANDVVPARESFADWVSLSEVLGVRAAALTWFDVARATLPPSEELSALVERHVVPLMLEHDRWSDAGTLYRNPLASLQTENQRRQMIQEPPPPELNMDPALVAETQEWAAVEFRKKAARLVRCLRAAERLEDATVVDAEARRMDPSDEMAAALSSEKVSTKE